MSEQKNSNNLLHSGITCIVSGIFLKGLCSFWEVYYHTTEKIYPALGNVGILIFLVGVGLMMVVPMKDHEPVKEPEK